MSNTTLTPGVRDAIAPIAVGVPAAAQAIGVSKVKFYELINSGQITTVKVGGRRLVPVSALNDFIAAEIEKQATSAPA